MIALNVETFGVDPEEQQREYAEYRIRQGRALVFMLPPEAVRPLLRRLYRRKSPSESVADDPLGALAEFCADLLPLPPLDVWLRDVRENPDAYVDSLDVSAGAPTVAAPATLDARRFRGAGSDWVAALRVFRDEEAWRGFIVFQSDRGALVHRTSLVFREEGPREVRDRFRSFEPAVLESFLRSAMA